MATYADLLTKYQTEREARTLSKPQPLCLVPSVYDTYREAREAHDHVVRANAIQGPDGPKQRASKSNPLTQTKEALDAAEKALNEVSLWLIFWLPGGTKHDEILKELDDEFGAAQTPARKRAFLAALFDHATTLTGERVDDFGPKELRDEMERQTNVWLETVFQDLVQAMRPPVFPMSRKS